MRIQLKDDKILSIKIKYKIENNINYSIHNNLNNSCQINETSSRMYLLERSKSKGLEFVSKNQSF